MTTARAQLAAARTVVLWLDVLRGEHMKHAHFCVLYPIQYILHTTLQGGESRRLAGQLAAAWAERDAIALQR